MGISYGPPALIQKGLGLCVDFTDENFNLILMDCHMENFSYFIRKGRKYN